MRVAIYARVSTPGQTCDNQLLQLREYAARRGFTSVLEFVDSGFSGTKARRPALDRLWAEVRARRVDLIVVWKFDRFSRSVRDLLNALAEFQHLGVQFISLTEGIDTSSPLGQAIYAIVGAVAQLERDLIRERVVAGLQRAKAAGVRLGRPRVDVSTDQVRMTYARTRSIRESAAILRVSPATVHRTLHRVRPVAPEAALAGGERCTR